MVSAKLQTYFADNKWTARSAAIVSVTGAYLVLHALCLYIRFPKAVLRDEDEMDPIPGTTTRRAQIIRRLRAIMVILGLALLLSVWGVYIFRHGQSAVKNIKTS